MPKRSTKRKSQTTTKKGMRRRSFLRRSTKRRSSPRRSTKRRSPLRRGTKRRSSPRRGGRRIGGGSKADQMEAKAIYALIEKLKKEGADAPTIFRQVRKLHEAYSAPSTKDLEKLEAKRNAAAAKRTFPSAPTSEKPTLMEQLIQARKNLGRRTPPLPEYHISSNYVPDHL